MSSQIKISKAIRTLESIKKLQEQAEYTDYNVGVFNGIELALSLLTNREPRIFKELIKSAPKIANYKDKIETNSESFGTQTVGML